jgi:hypothetical protein
MKSKLGFRNLVFFYIFYLSTPIFLISSSFISSAVVVRVGNDCSGILLPETNYIWTLSQCLDYENKEGNVTIKSKITVQKNNSTLPTSLIHKSRMDIDTLQNPTIIFRSKDWVLLRVDLPVDYLIKKIFYYTNFPNLVDTFSIGYPVVTDYKADAVRNYVDWLLLPQWQYQLDTFINKNQTADNQRTNINSSINTPLKELYDHGKVYLTDIRKSDPDILKKYILKKSIEFCIKKWTDNHYILNRLATLSTFEKEYGSDKIIKELNQNEDRLKEINGLASRLFITYSILPVDLLPETGGEIIMTFQKDYYTSAVFLIDHPEILNKLNISIRDIEPVDIKFSFDYPIWNQQDTVLEGNGGSQIIQKIKDKFWKVSGMSGAPVFYDGKLIGIQTIIPKYTSRELTFEKKINFISINELKELQALEEHAEIWKKISGIIGQQPRS